MQYIAHAQTLQYNLVNQSWSTQNEDLQNRRL